MNPETFLTLTLSASQLNIILAALNEAPYRISASLIAYIIEQANAARALPAV